MINAVSLDQPTQTAMTTIIETHMHNQQHKSTRVNKNECVDVVRVYEGLWWRCILLILSVNGSVWRGQEIDSPFSET